MRLILPVLLFAMIAGIGAAVLRARSVDADVRDRVAETRAAVEEIRERLLLQATLEAPNQRTRPYPETIDPAWFTGTLPRNAWFEGEGRPWIEVALEPDFPRAHPESIVAADEATASFWYNPATGVVRARVPATTADATAIERYNAINGTSVTSVIVPLDPNASIMKPVVD